jgi:uncharacterized Tic20 family protein
MSEFDVEGFEEVPLSEAGVPLPPGVTPNEISSEERNWAMLTHLSALSTIFIPIPGASILAPLIMWSMKKDSMPYVDYHGKEALNFNISFFIWGILAVIAGFMLFVIGLVVTVPLVFLTWLVLTIIGGVKANDGEYYEYPFTIRFVS